MSGQSRLRAGVRSLSVNQGVALDPTENQPAAQQRRPTANLPR
jgi:hypothetical protein